MVEFCPSKFSTVKNIIIVNAHHDKCNFPGVFPMWWFGFPAIMKEFIDNVFQHGIAYDVDGTSRWPNKWLTNKSARLIVTMDVPLWYNHIVLRNSAVNQLKRGVLHTSGVNPIQVTYISSINKLNDVKRDEWLEKVSHLGERFK